MAFTEGELDQWYQVAKEAALEAGKVLRRWTGRFSVKEKGRFDLVTEADVESQKVIHEFLMGRFPKHNFLGEEGGMEEKPPAPGSAPTWIVDPIDGTSNYANDFLGPSTLRTGIEGWAYSMKVTATTLVTGCRSRSTSNASFE
jgi:myo-inositol-1(or 4)-monophosphatase